MEIPGKDSDKRIRLSEPESLLYSWCKKQLCPSPFDVKVILPQERNKFLPQLKTQSNVKTENQNHSTTPRCSQIIPISTNLVSYKRTFGNSPIQILQVSFGVGGKPPKTKPPNPKTQSGQLLRSQKTSQRWCHIGLLHCVATIQRLMDTSLPAFVMATWVRSGQPENVGQEYWMGIVWDSKYINTIATWDYKHPPTWVGVVIQIDGNWLNAAGNDIELFHLKIRVVLVRGKGASNDPNREASDSRERQPLKSKKK